VIDDVSVETKVFMFNDSILIHRAGVNRFSFSHLEQSGDVFIFQTCMRSIAIVSNDNFEQIQSGVDAHDEIFQAHDVHRFLMQVVCGLKSALIGETEVSGQFKISVASFNYPETPWGMQLKRMFQNLFEDAKRVRQLYLGDLGSQSYGSILRREFKGLNRIHFLGAGHLVQEILPWLAKDRTEIHVHGRDPKKIAEQLKLFNNIQIHALDQGLDHLTDAEALVVAAPVTAQWLGEWVKRSTPHGVCLPLIADLRGDWAEDRLVVAHGSAHAPTDDFTDSSTDDSTHDQAYQVKQRQSIVLGLGELVKRISLNQEHVKKCYHAALNEIDIITLERSRRVEYRPFGWEDVCC
jgi:glutamyl-tRNA reductase